MTSKSKKRQQTMAKRAREQALKDRRARKQEKKQTAATRRRDAALSRPSPGVDQAGRDVQE
jgi:hypothetical protein